MLSNLITPGIQNIEFFFSIYIFKRKEGRRRHLVVLVLILSHTAFNIHFQYLPCAWTDKCYGVICGISRISLVSFSKAVSSAKSQTGEVIPCGALTYSQNYFLLLFWAFRFYSSVFLLLITTARLIAVTARQKSYSPVLQPSFSSLLS